MNDNSLLYQKNKSSMSGPVQEEETLDEQSVHRDPIKQFAEWFDEATAAVPSFPNAAILATATEDGKPSARVVLLKSYDADGFVFYTNYTSRKAEELKCNPQAELLFYWPELKRQVRIEGMVEKTSEQESDDYFQSRPRDSQIGAWASSQSAVIPNRQELEKRFKEIEKRYENQRITRPPQWGGYRLKPRKIEFWQSRESRLHDRLVYILKDDRTWMLQRLAP